MPSHTNLAALSAADRQLFRLPDNGGRSLHEFDTSRTVKKAIAIEIRQLKSQEGRHS
jgi:hypothetical protein